MIDQGASLEEVLNKLSSRCSQAFKGPKSWSHEQLINFVERFAINREALEKVLTHIQLFGQSQSNDCLFSNKVLTSCHLLLPNSKRKNKYGRDGFGSKEQVMMVEVMCKRWPQVMSWTSSRNGSLGLEQLRSLVIYWMRNRPLVESAMEAFPGAMEQFDKDFVSGKLDEDLIKRGMPFKNKILTLPFIEKFKDNLAKEAEMKKAAEQEVSSLIII